MKYILEIILVIIVVFFVWNILKRLFFKKFYQFMGNNTPQNQSEPKEKLKEGKHGLNWDAETVDYEEIKEDNKKNK